MWRRATFLVITTVAVAGVLAGVALSPILLAWLGAWLKFDVTLASQVGSGYGAASALLSAVALCVVAFTAVLQVRQTRIGQLQASRSLQLELLRMAMDQPQFRTVLGDDFKSLSPTAWREHAYLNLWMMYLQMAYLTGAINAAGVRRVALDELFANQKGIDYWAAADSSFEAEASTRAHRRFIAILRSAYAQGLRQRAEAAAATAQPTDDQC